MKVGVLCEFSGVVRDAFIRHGCEAVSCDLLPTEAPGPHIEGDCLAQDWSGYDLLVCHPPCTYLSVSGLHWNKRVPGREAKTEAALDFVRAMLSLPAPMIAMENPVSCISTRIRKPDQIIQPWQFGHNASKTTCLWLKGLPQLRHTKIVPPAGYQTVKFAMDLPLCECCGEEPWCPEHETHFADCECIGPRQDGVHYVELAGYLFGSEAATRPLWSNQTPSGQNRLGPSPDRWKLRSATYAGIAEAMADQWTRDRHAPVQGEIEFK